MPKIRVKGLDFYYELHGEGYPMVLIRGLGSNGDHWYKQVPEFSSQYKVLAFDNRGIGRSDKPESDFTISEMAEDTVGIMDSLGIEKAHIVALSMGGMIAQDIALKFPGKVNGLVLACTHCGGDRVVSTTEEIRKLFAEYILTGSPEAGQRAGVCLFAERTLRDTPEIVKQYRYVSAKYPPSSETMIKQWKAVQGHDTWDDLAKIQSPTLVITGKEDVLIPPENSTILAERITNAQLRVIEGGGHQFVVEKADAFNAEVLSFLKTVE